jgi:ubiquinone/menaquinone biosynthesis C-methylase UbiE
MSILTKVRAGLRNYIFPHQHPEVALRYLPIVDLLKKEKLDEARILEIGSGSYGITPYLKKPITGIDFDFSEPETALLRQVKGVGERLPFKDNEFDVCILSDVLEHIDAKKRAGTLNEAVRVAKRAVIISGPFGKEAAAQDRDLAEYSLKKIGPKTHHFFEEHLKYGLPEVEDIEKIVEQNKKVKSVKIIGHFLNLTARNFLMKRFISKNKFGFYFYLKGMMFLVPIFRKMNKEPAYRTLILVEIYE